MCSTETDDNTPSPFGRSPNPPPLPGKAVFSVSLGAARDSHRGTTRKRLTTLTFTTKPPHANRIELDGLLTKTEVHLT